MLTKRGVPLFYPFKNEKYRFPISYTTGSYFGNFFEGAIIVMSIAYIVYTLPKLL
jgi:inner membrane protein